MSRNPGKSHNNYSIACLTKYFQNSAGRVSYTSDVWSRNDLSAFMAMTAHYMFTGVNGQLYLRNRLVAFRHLQGSHTGEHLADVFFRVLQELSVLDRVSSSISLWLLTIHSSLIVDWHDHTRQRIKQ
jgi:hypothetical protein